MPVDDLKQIVDNVYLQGAHAAFVQITKFYSKKMDKLDKKTLSGKILTSNELNEVKQCTSLMKNLNEIGRQSRDFSHGKDSPSIL